MAAFDFDGTVSRRDTLLPFLQRLCGAQRVFRALAGTLVGSGASRDRFKDAVLIRLLAGREQAEVEAAGDAYAEFLLSAGRLRPEAVRRLAEHRERDHRVVIVSASPEVYVAPLGRRLGVDAVLATRLAVGADGRLTGRMDGRNCRGPEKVARLEAWLDGSEPGRLWAYGDSRGDRELLSRADVGHLVRPRRPFPTI